MKRDITYYEDGSSLEIRHPWDDRDEYYYDDVIEEAYEGDAGLYWDDNCC